MENSNTNAMDGSGAGGEGDTHEDAGVCTRAMLTEAQAILRMFRGRVSPQEFYSYQPRPSKVLASQLNERLPKVTEI